MKITLYALLVSILAHVAQADTLRLAVTTSFENSGLADVLLPQIAQDTGIEVQLLVVGTGQALRLGAAGDVDAILVHARRAEETFVADGNATHRREIMYNDFVLIGPRDDPAMIQQSTTARQAMIAIAAAKPVFVSRGDDSGTHKAEQSLWSDAGLSVADFRSWYNVVGAGMGAALNTASGLNAYVLADRASWLNFQNKGDLALLFAGDPAMFNQYAYLPVNPAKHPHVNAQAALRLEAWLTGDTAAELINGYAIAGQSLFHFNADQNQ